MKSVPTIYEDASLIVINKPAGLVVHSDGRTKEETLSDMLASEYPEMKDVGEPMIIRSNGEEKKIFRPGIVHRLDRDTSGVMIIAKTKKTFEFIKKEFQSRSVKKHYLAIVWGHVKEDSGAIDRPLGRSPSDFRQFSAHATARGEKREAKTAYKTLKRFETKEGQFSYLEVSPETGRTHQIRAHLKFINHPVVCDGLYAGKRGCALGLSRLALHSFQVEFTHPDTSKRIRFEAPIPNDLEKAVKGIA